MILLDKGETIRKVIREKPYFFIVEAIIIAIIALLPLIVYYLGYFHTILSVSSSNALAAKLQGGASYISMFFYSIWLLACWIFLFISWTEYYLETWLLTDARLITVTHVGIWSRDVSALRFDKIKDVSVEDGKIKIILTDDEGKMFIGNIFNPEQIKELITIEQKKALMRLEHSVTMLDSDQMTV